MRPFFSLRLAVLGLFFATGAVCAAPQPKRAPKPYVNDELASEGAQLAQKAQEGSKDLRARTPPAELQRQMTDAALRNDLPQQLTLLEALAAATPDDPAAWLALARAQWSASTIRGAEAGKLQDLALAAAWLSYQKAKAPGDEANALALIGQIFAAREAWRDALNADALSLKAEDNADLRKTYDDMREKHGFRVLEIHHRQ